MLPAKPNNQQARNTRANSRRNPKGKTNKSRDEPNFKTSRSKHKSKESNCANETSDTEYSVAEPTVNTGMINRKNVAKEDGKSTVKKINFENKPIIKELTKKLNNYSKQYAPEYFITVLEYMIEKEVKNTMSPTVSKINIWRAHIERQREIQAQVRREVNKMTNLIITGRKKFKEEMKKQEKRNKANYQWRLSDSEKQLNQIYSQLAPSQKNNENSDDSKNSDSSQQNSQLYNESCPSRAETQPSSLPERVNQKTFSKQWDTRFDQFASLVQTMYDLLGQNECHNTIFPACYIFYMMCVADARVFNLLSSGLKNWESMQYSNSYPSQGIHRSRSREPTPMEMVEYYMIVSILIATKYHEIYPASLVDLIDSVNCTLSYDHSIKIEGQVLEMLNFNQFYNENQLKFMRMFIIAIGWGAKQSNVCEFILQSGLNNPRLYTYSPLYKAAIVLGIYEQQFYKTQQKFMLLKSLCPGLTYDLITVIKNQYKETIMYNSKNRLNAQKKKFFIFESEFIRIADA